MGVKTGKGMLLCMLYNGLVVTHVTGDCSLAVLRVNVSCLTMTVISCSTLEDYKTMQKLKLHFFSFSQKIRIKRNRFGETEGAEGGDEGKVTSPYGRTVPVLDGNPANSATGHPSPVPC